MGDCSRLAKLPEPSIAPIDIVPSIRNVSKLEKGLDVVVEDGPPAVVDGDRDQLEQVMINLLKNAVEASLEAGGEVRIHWRSAGGFVEVVVTDSGPGLPDSANLFVPFYTTKPSGSGIGLFLSRQIAEAHGGSVTVRNRENAAGCEAILRIPETGA